MPGAVKKPGIPGAGYHVAVSNYFQEETQNDFYAANQGIQGW